LAERGSSPAVVDQRTPVAPSASPSANGASRGAGRDRFNPITHDDSSRTGKFPTRHRIASIQRGCNSSPVPVAFSRSEQDFICSNVQALVVAGSESAIRLQWPGRIILAARRTLSAKPAPLCKTMRPVSLKEHFTRGGKPVFFLIDLTICYVSYRCHRRS